MRESEEQSKLTGFEVGPHPTPKTRLWTGLLRGFRTVVSVDFLCCEDVLLVSVVDVVGPLVAKR